MNDCTHRREAPRWPWAACLAALLLTACATPQGREHAGGKDTRPEETLIQPEGPSGLRVRIGRTFGRHAVATAHPAASAAGLEMMRAGGSAIDAAIAAQMVLSLVEPQSSGIGGGAFLLHHDGRRVQAFDGRETAPREARETLFLGPDGKPVPFMKAVVGGRSVGVPGAVAMLALAHRQHGQLPWARLFEPAIRLAEEGFGISPRLHTLLAAEQALRDDPVARAYFYGPDGQPHPIGHPLRNPELARVLRSLASQGPRALHEGPVAEAIERKVRQHPGNPGFLDREDLRAYVPKEREPLCFAHDTSTRRVRICGFPPPSSGALAIGQMLGLLSRAPTGALTLGSTPDASWLHSYAEASRLAFADRARYVADPDVVAPPAGRRESLLDPAYLDIRARLVGPTRIPRIEAGEPAGTVASWAPMPGQPEYGTSHISVVDARGNALAMTTTIEAGFGSRLMVTTDPGRPGGFLLNNQLTDFSFTPAGEDGQAIANRVQPGKRPRSSMSPTLVLDDDTGELLMSTGSPGGALIIHFTARTLLGMLHGDLSAQQAIDLPNFGTLGGPVLLEAGRFPRETVEALQARGHDVSEIPMPSGIQALQRGTRDGQVVWHGGADPRREGLVAGD
ncbi:MAG: gamma-glutamyltransferase family protein [Gammaproteobacteria bacterium]